MSKDFNGVVNVDIRDSVEDWAPFVQPKAPDGAPNVLMIVWDDVGYGARLGEKHQKVSSDQPITAGKHLFVTEFAKTGDDPATGLALGTLTLYIDTEPVGKGEIMTQPGNFALTGDGLCVGRDSLSPVSPDYAAPFRFTGGSIDRVVIDVSGDHYVDHEKEAQAWLLRD